MVSLAGPWVSLSAVAATDVRGGMWRPWLCDQSVRRPVCWIQSHWTNFLAASTFLPLALAQVLQPPTCTTGLPPGLKAGHGRTPESSPGAVLMAGIDQRPPHCIGTAFRVRAAGSHQPVVKQSSRDRSS